MNLNKYKEELSIFLRENNIDYVDLNYYITAFTHGSFNNKTHKIKKTYQLLEFLGDSLIGSYAAKLIYNYLNLMNINDPGIATKIKADAVNNKSLSKLTKVLGIDHFILHSLQDLEIKEITKLKGDVFESLVGAIYNDIGMNGVNLFLNTHLKPIIQNDLKNVNKYGVSDHPKSAFQELVQNSKMGVIKYITTEKKDDKNIYFESKLTVNEMIFGIGNGSNKREAETEAAINGLKKYKKIQKKVGQ